MNLVMRDTLESDLDQCLALASDRFLYDARSLRLMRRMWSHIINSRAGEAGVLVSPHRMSNVLFFGFSVFVTNERARRYQELKHPGIALGMAEEWNAGGQPFLELAEIARANATDGLNLVVTHYGFAAPAGDEALGDQLRFASYESFRKHHEGLNFRSFTHEVFDPSSMEMGQGWGFRVGYYSEQALRAVHIPVDKAPCVWMATRIDARGRPGAVFPNMLFRTHVPPQFGFSLREQMLLKLGLEGFTDDGIAAALGASMATVKKRLRSIYDKVHDASPDDGSGPISGQHPNGARGREMRRSLLNYLRAHPEELHPYNVAHRSRR